MANFKKSLEDRLMERTTVEADRRLRAKARREAVALRLESIPLSRIPHHLNKLEYMIRQIRYTETDRHKVLEFRKLVAEVNIINKKLRVPKGRRNNAIHG